MSSEAKKNSLLSYDNITPEQSAAIDALYGGNRLLIAGVGFGKCAVAQTAIQELLEDKELKRVLVLAPLKVCQLTWANEWRKWEHLRRPMMALGDAGARHAAIDSEAQLVVMNIENVPWLFEQYGDQHGFDGLLIDEISKFKSAGSQGVKKLRTRTRDFAWRCGMSATPVAESGIDIYAQVLLIDGGKALGRNKEVFMRNHFYPTDYEQRNWKVLPGQEEVLARKLAPVIYAADDVAYKAGLPELRDEVVNITLAPYAQRAYDEMCETAYLEEQDVEAVNEAVVSGKLQQLTAGAVYAGTKLSGRRACWIHEQKFDALERLMAEADGPVMVAYNFQFEKDMLAQRFPEMLFLGDDPGKVEQLWNTGEIPAIACHPKSASHGLNLQYGGHELIVLTAPWGADPWQQLVGRLCRRGQKSPYVRRTTIVALDTVDEVVLERHLNKRADEGSLMTHLRARALK